MFLYGRWGGGKSFERGNVATLFLSHAQRFAARGGCVILPVHRSGVASNYDVIRLPK